MNKYESNDYLFIKKNFDDWNSIESEQEIESEFYFRDDDCNIDIWYDEDCVFDGDEFRVLSNFRDKLNYLLASIYEDTNTKNLIREIIPNVERISFNTVRSVRGNNLTAWMHKYGFTLKDFLTNKKYIVVIDSNLEVMHDLSDLGLINWDDFAECSCDIDYSEWIHILKEIE